MKKLFYRLYSHGELKKLRIEYCYIRGVLDEAYSYCGPPGPQDSTYKFMCKRRDQLKVKIDALEAGKKPESAFEFSFNIRFS